MQSPLYNQDLNFHINFKSELGRPIPDEKIIHLPNLKELHPDHISAPFYVGMSSGCIKLAPLPHLTRYLDVISGGVNGVLIICDFNFHRNNLVTLLTRVHPIYSAKKCLI